MNIYLGAGEWYSNELHETNNNTKILYTSQIFLLAVSNIFKFLIINFFKRVPIQKIFFFNPCLCVPYSTFLMAFFLIPHSPQVTLSWCNRTILISNNQFYYYENLRDRTLNTYHVISFDKTSLHFSKSNIMKRKFNNYKNLWHKVGVNMHSICTAVWQHISFLPHT